MQRAGPPPRGSVALITTERFRTDHNDHLRTFVYGNLHCVQTVQGECDGGHI